MPKLYDCQVLPAKSKRTLDATRHDSRQRMRHVTCQCAAQKQGMKLTMTLIDSTS